MGCAAPRGRGGRTGLLAHKEPPEIRGIGYCVDALEAALWAVGGANDFAEAVLRAANLGDDADTTAAIAGQLAGPAGGVNGIPQAWRDKLVLRARIKELATGCSSPAVLEDSRDPGWPHDADLHAWWVDPGQVLAGEYPRARIDAAACGEGQPPRRRRHPHLHRPHHAARPARAVRTAVAEPPGHGNSTSAISRADPRSRRPHDAEYDDILGLIAEHRTRGGVYVHCWGGVGRTGTVVGCMLADRGARLRHRHRQPQDAAGRNQEERPTVPGERGPAGGPLGDGASR